MFQEAKSHRKKGKKESKSIILFDLKTKILLLFDFIKL
jgi:hypothetical protein